MSPRNESDGKKLGDFSQIVRDIRRLLPHMNTRRKRQLAALLGLQIFGGFTEVISLGALLPFLAVLANAEEFLRHPQVQHWANLFGIRDELTLTVVLSVGFVTAFVLVNGVRLLTLWVQSRLSAAVGSDLSTEFYHRVLNQDFEYHLRTNSGTLISMALNDLNASLGLVFNVMMILTQGLAIVAIVVAMLVYDPTIAGTTAFITCLAYTIVMRVNKRRLVQNGLIVSDNRAVVVRMLQVGLGGIRDVLLGRKQTAFLSRYAQADRAFRQASARSRVITTAPRYFLEAFGVGLLVAVAAYLTTSSGDLFGVLPIVGGLAMAVNRILPAAQQVYGAYALMQSVHVSVTRTLAVLERPMDPANLNPIIPIPPLRKAVMLDNIWFRYEGSEVGDQKSEWILRGVSLTIPVNKTVALVGATGSGKTTIADVLLGLLQPERGRILLDDEPLDAAKLPGWRAIMANVPQAIFLIDSSVSENIAFGVPAEEIDHERVRQAARLARVAEFVEGRPSGYDEIIGEHGIRLSGGQRQRIGIARALYRAASVIVFDEATSALDNRTEQAVMQAIDQLKGQKTIVIIAHRLTTIQNADVIYQIDAGRVVAQGTYEELLERSTSFRHMVNAAGHVKRDNARSDTLL